MYKKDVLVINKSGLHARPAAEFVGMANKFKSDILIYKENSPIKANAKSMIFVLSLTVKPGQKITIEASGEDEKEAVETLVELINSGFGEE